MIRYVFNKNLAITKFEKHIKIFVGEDRYMSSGTPEGRVSEDENMSREYRDFNG